MLGECGGGTLSTRALYRNQGYTNGPRGRSPTGFDVEPSFSLLQTAHSHPRFIVREITDVRNRLACPRVQKRMRSLFNWALVVASMCCCASGEHFLSVGVKGGVPLTDALSDRVFNGGDVIERVFSDSKNYVVGPFVEINLPLGLSVEADALYRPLNVTSVTRVLPLNAVKRRSVDVPSLEVPILMRYRLRHDILVKPYVEAGPVFRVVASKKAYLSNAGFALGTGIDCNLALVRISPELRYSHWGADALTSVRNVSLPPSHQNQAELLVGLSF